MSTDAWGEGSLPAVRESGVGHRYSRHGVVGLVAVVAILSLVALACGDNEGDSLAALQEEVDRLKAELPETVATGATTTAAPTSTSSQPLTYCDEVLAIITEMSGAEENDLAQLARVFVGPDPGNAGGIRVVGLSAGSQTGDPLDYRWSIDDGLAVVGPFLETPDKSRFPAVVSYETASPICEENETVVPPPTPAPTPPPEPQINLTDPTVVGTAFLEAWIAGDLVVMAELGDAAAVSGAARFAPPPGPINCFVPQGGAGYQCDVQPPSGQIFYVVLQQRPDQVWDVTFAGQAHGAILDP